MTLGDTAVPELMQTDAFELMVKDPNLRALAASPGFQALASQPQVMEALMANPKAFAALAANPSAFSGVAQAAQSMAAAAPQAEAHNAQLLAAAYNHSAAMSALAAHPQALAAIAANPAAFADLSFTAFAMGAENATMEHNGQVRVGLTYMTGSVVKLGQALAYKLTNAGQVDWLPLTILWSGFIAGVAAGAMAASSLGFNALWLASAAAVLFAIVARKDGLLGQAE